MASNFLTPTVTMLPKYEETVKGSELPAWVSAAGKELYEQSRSLTGQGSPLYTGDRIASYDDISGETEMGFNMVNTADGYDPTTGNYYFNNQAFTDKSAYDEARTGYYTPTSTGEIDYSQIMDMPSDGYGEGVLSGLYRSKKNPDGSYHTKDIYDSMGNKVSLDSDIIPYFQSSASGADLLGGMQEMETGVMGAVQSKMTKKEQEAQALLGKDTYQGYLTGFDTTGDGIADTDSADTFLKKLGSEFKLGEGTEAQKYMDMYSDAMNPAIRDIQDRTIQEQNAMRAKAARAGAYGGSRLGIQEALLGSEGIQSGADLRTEGLAAGLTFASGRFDTGQEQAATAMDSYKQMATLTQNLQEQQAAGLITAGEAERLLDQKALDIAYADFLDQKNQGKEDLNFKLGVLQGTPYDTVSRGYTMSQTAKEQPSVYGQAIGALGSIGSMAAM
jgi:hypothetical protein